MVDLHDGCRRTITLGPWGTDEAHEESQRLLAGPGAARPNAPTTAAARTTGEAG